MTRQRQGSRPENRVCLAGLAAACGGQLGYDSKGRPGLDGGAKMTSQEQKQKPSTVAAKPA